MPKTTSRATRKNAQPARDPRALTRRYLEAQPPATRRALQQIRAIVRSVAPKAEEAFSYGIPGFRLDAAPLLWYAGWKTHVGLYPVGTALAEHGIDVSAYAASKGTVRFPLDSPLPQTLIKRIVKVRAAIVRAASKAR